MTASAATGPLSGVKVLDVSALGPGPYCSMILADFGADVITVERPGPPEDFDPSKFFSRGKRSIVVDIRTEDGAELIRSLASTVDVFLEGFRPGAMERRGLGPDDLMALNPRLIYTRLTGYGQDGPSALVAGHDINYLAAAGLLGALGDDERGPSVPLNLLGDFASGSQSAALGISMALFRREKTSRGQLIDAAMVDGAAALLAAQLAEYSAGFWLGPGKSVLSGSAPFYTTYRCSDGGWFAVGAIESRFYKQMIGALELDADALPNRNDQANWATLRETFGARFAEHTRDHWAKLFSTIDGCGSAVLKLDELADDPHLAHRGTVYRNGELIESAPAPRLSEQRHISRDQLKSRGQHTREILGDFGLSEDRIAELERSGAIAQAER